MGTTLLNKTAPLYTYTNNTSFIQFADFNSSVITAEKDLLNAPSVGVFIDANNKYTAELGINIISDLPRTIGEIPITSNFELLQAAPLDARTIAKTEANILSAAWWLGKSNNKPVYLYKGMVISTMDTGQVYIYTGSNLKITKDDDETNEYLKADSWSKVSGGKSEKDIVSTLKYTSGNIDASGYVLSHDTDIFGITMTDYYTLLGGHIREDEDTSNAYCYTDYNACIVNANSNNVIHNFNGIYIPTKKAKNYFSESSSLLNSIILLNLNGGKITLLSVDIDNVSTGDSSISKDDIESIANKSVLNLDTSYAELCLESNISAETPTRAGIKITRDAETLSTNVAIDASTLKINANKIYPWNNTAITAPTSNDNSKIATYNATDDTIYWQSFNNLKAGGNSYNGIVEANAKYNRYVKIATTEVYSYIKATDDNPEISLIKPQILPNNGYINFNGNVNNVYSIDGSFKIYVDRSQRSISSSAIVDYVKNKKISKSIASYALSINNYKLGTKGINTDMSQFNLPVGVKISDEPSLTKSVDSNEYDYRLTWMVSLYLFVPSSSILEYYTYSEYWNNTNTDNPTSIIETGGELTFDSDKNILYANTLYDYSYDAGILNDSLNNNLTISARIDNVTCIKPTYNYTVEYPAYKSDSETLISLQDTPNIPWKYYNNNSSLGAGLIKARSLSNTNKVDFFADYNILSKLSFNSDISNIGTALIENGTTLNAISLIMYLFKDIQQKILYLNNTVIKIVDQTGFDIDTSKDANTSVSTFPGINGGSISNRIALINASLSKVDASLVDFSTVFNKFDQNLLDLSEIVDQKSSLIDDISGKTNDNTSRINNFDTRWTIFDGSINNKFIYFDQDFSKFRQEINTSFNSFKENLDSSMSVFKQFLDSSIKDVNTSMLSYIDNISNYASRIISEFDSSIVKLTGLYDSSFSRLQSYIDTNLSNFKTNIDGSIYQFRYVLDASLSNFDGKIDQFNTSINNQIEQLKISDINKNIEDLASKVSITESSIVDVSYRIINTSNDITKLYLEIAWTNSSVSTAKTNINKINTSIGLIDNTSFITKTIPDLIQNYQNVVNTNTSTLSNYITNVNDNMNIIATALSHTISDVSVITDAIDKDSNISDSTKKILNSNALYRPLLSTTVEKYTYTLSNNNLEVLDNNEAEPTNEDSTPTDDASEPSL